MTESRTISELELKILYKKYQDYTSQLSYSNKKRKIDCESSQCLDPLQNDIVNNLLDDDCLAEIFMYLPVYERPKLSFVCKKWNRALDLSWSQVKKLEILHWEYNDCQNILSKYTTAAQKIKFFRLLLNKCGRYLTDLNLTIYGGSQILSLIDKFCPNIVKLRLRFKYIEKKNFTNAFSCMSKLKILKVIFQINSDIPDIFFNSLKNIADNLNELSLANWNPQRYKYQISDSFIYIISQLNVLQKFELFGIQINNLLRNYIKNSQLEFYHHDEIYLGSDICLNKYFENIKILNLKNYEITDDFLYNLANNAKSLEKLITRCELITVVGIKIITNMNGLKGLFLRCRSGELIDDSSIRLLKNLQLLDLPRSHKITDDLVTQILENSPDLEFLSVIYSGITSEFIKRAAKISTDRKKVLRLVVSFESGIFNTSEYLYESPYFRIIYLDDLSMKCRAMLHLN